MQPKLKTLEGLVQETASRLRKLQQENRRLRLDLEQRQEHNGRLEAQLKRMGALGAKHAKIRNRIERLVHKLDKVAG